eukprot:scaffold130111_cov67-Phaeocystis_antarctica.AAC.2
MRLGNIIAACQGATQPPPQRVRPPHDRGSSRRKAASKAHLPQRPPEDVICLLRRQACAAEPVPKRTSRRRKPDVRAAPPFGAVVHHHATRREAEVSRPVRRDPFALVTNPVVRPVSARHLAGVPGCQLVVRRRSVRRHIELGHGPVEGGEVLVGCSEATREAGAQHELRHVFERNDAVLHLRPASRCAVLEEEDRWLQAAVRSGDVVRVRVIVAPNVG